MSVTDPDDIHATCTAAADLLERNGWIQGELWTGRSVNLGYVPGLPLCTIGALGVALGIIDGDKIENLFAGEGSCKTREALEREVRERTGGGMTAVWRYNDTRTAEEAIGLLRDVAAKHQPDAYRSGAAG